MPIHAVIAALIVACCWGGNFSASKFALMDFSPYLTVILRFIVVSAVLAPFALRQKPWPRPRDMIFLAVTLIALHFALIFVAMTMGLTITSVIVATQMGVPFACVVSAILFKDYLGPWRSLALMVAFLGVLVVALTPNAAAHPDAFLLAVFGALAWASANIYMKRLPPTPVVALLFWPALFSLPILLVLTLTFEHGQVEAIKTAHWFAWAGIGYSTIFSSLIGYGMWNRLITKYPLSQVVPYSLCVPIAGITGGVVMFGEPLTLQILGGALLTIIGVGIITLRRPKLAELEKM
jgi:O-acetylserine/cysteine efflux transporter